MIETEFRTIQDDLLPRYDIAPTQDVLAIARDGETGEDRAGRLRWGLVPHRVKDPSIGSRMINARAETLATKPAFRTAYRRHRCLVVADGFYEWAMSRGRSESSVLDPPTRRPPPGLRRAVGAVGKRRG